MVLAAAESLADILERSRFGIAMAAMIRMIATTISNSISEKPFCLRIQLSPLRFLGCTDGCSGRFSLYLAVSKCN